MSAYLARLKQLEDGKNYHYAPDTVPPKPPEPPFAGFDGTGAGHIEKIIDDAVIGTPPEQTPVKPLSLKDRQREARRKKSHCDVGSRTRYAAGNLPRHRQRPAQCNSSNSYPACGDLRNADIQSQI